ncbi:site-specific integrase [Saccharopolyspora pogona]|uniref:site-specific integrase n=1 Tax=Saccharopolyspora pogona TaxID=333966 RepID=UPI001CC262B9|nr:site-specific integrase [Saccharopolyspora pogona]
MDRHSQSRFRRPRQADLKKGSGKTKTEAKDKLKEILRDHEDGLSSGPENYTVAHALANWIEYGLNGRERGTVETYRYQIDGHIVPFLGKQKLRALTADDVDKWLAGRARVLSTRTLRMLHSILNRAVRHAQARDKVKRNVVGLCDVPTGREGRPSKAFTLEQAEAVLKAAGKSRLHAYIVLSILIGARTEELRALTWDLVDLDGSQTAEPPVPRSIAVWRSVRAKGETKTKKSRRTLAMPMRCVVALRAHRLRQRRDKQLAGERWQEHNLVFASLAGTPLDAHNVRRAFRKVIREADCGLTPTDWTPREMRHSFVSLLSDSGVRVEDIARLVGHSGTTVTETVYRKQIRPVIIEGAQAMDQIFARSNRESQSRS